METTLHRQLKDRFGAGCGGRTEVSVAGFRVDAVGVDGELIEVQSAALAPLRPKLLRLLPGHRVRVVKPVVIGRRVVRRARADGPDLSARRSPRRGAAADVFDDLIGLTGVFPDPNLRIDVLTVEIDEIRVPRPRPPGYAVIDRGLRAVVEAVSLREAADLWALLPGGLASPFTTFELADRLGRPIAFAQRVAYCLRLSGAVEAVGKVGNRLVYEPRSGMDLAGDPRPPSGAIVKNRAAPRRS